MRLTASWLAACDTLLLTSFYVLSIFLSSDQIKLAFFVAIVGVVLTVLGVGTEFWVELAAPKTFYNNQVALRVTLSCPTWW